MIIAQPKEGIADFVAACIGLPANSWKDFSALGWIKDNTLVAGVVYSRWSDGDVCAHIGSLGNYWLNRKFLFSIFDYPFNQANCRRITALVADDNAMCKRFVASLGFTLEGRMRNGTPYGDLLVYGMLKKECKWISAKYSAQRLSGSANLRTAA